MGGTDFRKTIKVREGESLEEAFRRAKRSDERRYGNDAYTGTIGQKNGFVEVDIPEDLSAQDVIEIWSNVYRGGTRSEGDDIWDRRSDDLKPVETDRGTFPVWDFTDEEVVERIEEHPDLTLKLSTGKPFQDKWSGNCGLVQEDENVYIAFGMVAR